MNDLYTYANDLYPVISKRFDLEYANYVNVMNSIIGVETTDRVDVREEGIGGFGEIPDYDGSTVPELTQKRGYTAIYTPKEKLAKCTVGYKKAKIDMSGIASRTGEYLAGSIGMTRLMDFYRMFSNGFSSSYLGGDGKSLFATDHPMSSDPQNTQTFSNSITSPFSISAITAAQSTARRFLTPDGLPFLSKYDLILVSPELEPKAKEFFGLESKLIPESAENGSNPLFNTKYFVIDGFAAKQWAVGDSRLIKKMMKLVQITAPRTDMQKAANPYFTEYFVYADYTMGFSDWRQIIGSNPA